MKDFPPNFLTMSVKVHKSLHILFASLKHCLVPNRQGVTDFSWVFLTLGVRNMLFHKTFLRIDITLLALYIALCPYNHLHQQRGWSLGEELIKVPCFKTILKLSYTHFLVWMNNYCGDFIKTVEVFPQWFREALSNVKQTSGGHLSMSTGCKLVHEFLH